MKTSTITRLALAFYLVGAVACAGPAFVEEDRLEASEKDECQTIWIEASAVSVCSAWARNDLRPVIKTVFWPLWFSYRVALAA